MPEGPELHLAARYVNSVCEGVIFSGQVEKSEVSKNPEVPFSSQGYRITATARGKEVKLSLTPIKWEAKSPMKGHAKQCLKTTEKEEPMDLVFRFGMSGTFRFTPADDVPKHAHLRFYTAEPPRNALCFVDTRRFGSWEVNGTWQPDRGPCIMLEYEQFRENVMKNLQDKAFDKPICEALLNQKYFNGIGNYLRAEILFRLKIPLFVMARTVLESLANPVQQSDLTLSKKLKLKKENPDLLELCHLVPMEVMNLPGKGYGSKYSDDYSAFGKWLQCYYVAGMKSLRDSNGRTIWFEGDPGPLAPKGEKKNKKRRTLIKADPDTKLVKVTTPKRKQKSQSSGSQEESIGANEGMQKMMVRKKAVLGAKKLSNSADKKRKGSLQDSITPQTRGRIQRPRRGSKSDAVKGSTKNSPLVKEVRTRKLSKGGGPAAHIVETSKNSQQEKRRSRQQLKKQGESSSLIKNLPKDSQMQKGRKRQAKKEGEQTPLTEEPPKNSQQETRITPKKQDLSARLSKTPPKGSRALKGQARQLKKKGEPVSLTEVSTEDSHFKEAAAHQPKKEEDPAPINGNSLEDSPPLDGGKQQLKNDTAVAPLTDDLLENSSLAKGRRSKTSARKRAGSPIGIRMITRQLKVE
ncbi:endonuclease 8-like 1 isoform X1 [Pleurodeles waltl]|uniref:endonuclease 8-like 1 isoform X1 n=1 Tax=Pleurodeles waltl TaxID=8319 RepID=UPI0037097504